MKLEGYNAVLSAAGLEKTAVVPRAKKQYRRALQMLLEDNTAFHGTTATGLGKILSEGRISPGTVNNMSPMDMQEVYMGRGRPAFIWSHNRPAVAVPMDDLMKLEGDGPGGIPTNLPSRIRDNPERAAQYRHPTIVREADWKSGGWSSPGGPFAVDWVLSPHPVPLTRKSTIIPRAPLSNEEEERVRALGMRRIPYETFWRALKDLHPNAPDWSYVGRA